MDTTIILAVLGSSAVTAVVMAFLNRRARRAGVQKTLAEAEQITGQTQRDTNNYYRGRVEDTIEQMVDLQEQVEVLRTATDEIQGRYEQRIGQLHNKIDGLTTQLNRANAALDRANRTIDELRDEVKSGNQTIIELRAEIAGLLIDRAEKE